MKLTFPKSILFLSIFCLFISCNSQNKTTEAHQKTDNVAIPNTSKNINATHPQIKPSKVDSALIMEDVKYLASDELQGRGSGLLGNEIARKFIAKRFEDLGLEKITPDYFQDFEFSRKKDDYFCRNVIGKIEGSEFKNKYIVLTAHYDHLGMRKGEIFNGADDNASGVAATMAAAAYFKKNPPKHSILFVALDAEELGLKGANHFVANSPVPLEEIKLNLNLDMISRNKKNEIYICGTHHYAHLKKALINIDDTSPLHVKFGHDTPNLGHNDWTNSSDHAPFHQKKIPFLYLGVEDHEDYHKPTDTFDKIDKSFLHASSNLVIDIILTFEENGL